MAEQRKGLCRKCGKRIIESATVPGKWMHIYPEPSHKPESGRTE